MRKDAASLAALVAALLILPAAARAGTYDVVSCNTPLGEGGGINRAWTVEAYNLAGRPASASAFSVPPAPERCDTPAGLVLTSLPGTAAVHVQDGAGFIFRAPAGTTVRDASVWRYSLARMTIAAAGSPYWASAARAGTAPGGSIVLGGTSGRDYCPGTFTPTPTPATPYCVKGAPGGFTATGIPATYTSIGQPVISWGIGCDAPTPTALCATASPATASPPNGAYASMQFQGAKVTVEDPVAPEVGVSGTLEGWLRPADAHSATATDSTGIRALRILVDGAERATQGLPVRHHLAAPCPASVAQPLDLTGLADGRHTLTTIAEDTAGNVARADRTVDLDGSAPAIDLVPVTGRRIAATVSDALSGVQGGTIEVRAKPDAPFAALKTTLRGGRLAVTVPRHLHAGDVGIRVSATDRAATS